MQILLVGNPTAQSGKAEARIQAALAAMDQRGWQVALLETLPEGRTVAAVAQAVDAGTADVVVYLGGDGTFAEVAKGLLSAKRVVPMGMLPSGTANNQGRSFGVSNKAADLEENLDVIAAAHLTQLDVGQVDKLDEQGDSLAARQSLVTARS